MQTLKISDNTARKLYPTAPAEFKTVLEETFGGKDFFNQVITDRVKTFIDVLAEQGKCIADFNSECRGLSTDEIAYRKLKLIAKVLNEGWEPNWDKGEEEKWHNWFKMSSGFSFNIAYYYLSLSGVGSRLCFKSKKLAEHAARHFLDIYKEFYT
jgi:hypothetical protein